jgi:hypothetical protein
VLDLARKVRIDRKQIYYSVERGCRRFGRTIVFPPMLSNELFVSFENISKSM